MNKLKVSIGIPTLNEQANIIQLLSAIISQEERRFVLHEIIVITDGSTDRTTDLVKRFISITKNKKIKLIIGRNRLGQQIRQNQIIERYTGDLLVFMEADILPSSTSTLYELVSPFLGRKDTNLGMVVGEPKPIKARTFFEHIMNEGHSFKQSMFKKWKNGDNLYAAGGHSMKAISRSFSNQLVYPIHVPEDAYTYLRLKQLGFRMQRNSKAKAYMRNVTHFNDRIRQCTKFQSGKNALYTYFGREFVVKEYKPDLSVVLPSIFKEFFKSPFWFSLYLMELVLNRLFTRHVKKFNAIHKTYQSSKSLVKADVFELERILGVTIGIPVYNEGENIGKLLKLILNQEQFLWKLDKIIVVSDGSTDKTEKIVTKLNHPKIELYSNKSRIGQALTQNVIIEHAKSDVLVLLNADILPVNKHMISNLINPFYQSKNLGIVSGKVIPEKAINFFAKIINFSHIRKQALYDSISDSIYLCHGRVRAFSREFYSSLKFPALASEDAYSFLACKTRGLSFSYAPDAQVVFMSPSNFEDHYRQSSRFFNSIFELSKYFPKRDIIHEYSIPNYKKIQSLIISFLINPFFFSLYALLTLSVIIKKYFTYKKDNYIWEPSISSKKLSVITF